MPLPIITQTFRTVLNWRDSTTGLTAHNVWHFTTNAAGKTAAQVNANVNAHVTQAMWDWAAGTAVVESISTTPLDGITAAVTFTTGNPAKWTGGGLGSSLPQVAGEVKFATALRGPEHRGRMFVPFVGEGEVSGRLLTDVAAVQAAFAAFGAAVAADATTPMAHVVASYANSGAEAITSYTAQSTTYTVGKRNPH